jgi:hypothetical protein
MIKALCELANSPTARKSYNDADVLPSGVAIDTRVR